MLIEKIHKEINRVDKTNVVPDPELDISETAVVGFDGFVGTDALVLVVAAVAAAVVTVEIGAGLSDRLSVELGVAVPLTSITPE